MIDNPGQVSFLDVATKRGVTDMTQQLAKGIQQTAAELAKSKAKQDLADKADLKLLTASLTAPTKLNRLFYTPAQQELGNAILNIKQLYATSDPQRAIKGQVIANNTLELVKGEMAERSVNLNTLETLSKKSNLWWPKEAKTLLQNYGDSHTYDEFVKKQQENPTPNYYNIETDALDLPPPKEKIDTEKVLNSSFGLIKPMQLGEKKQTVIALDDDEANAYYKQFGVKPNTIQQVAETYLDKPLFLEQYVDAKNIPVQNVQNMTPDEKNLVYKSLLDDGKRFRSEKYPNSMNININNKINEDENNILNAFSKGVGLVPHKLVANGKETIQWTPQFGNAQVINQPETEVSNFQGAVDRNGEPLSNSKIPNAKLNNVAIMPFTIVKNKQGQPTQKGVFNAGSIEDIKNARGFQIYYIYNSGDVNIPAYNFPNLQFNVGGKDPVAYQRSYLTNINEYQKKLNNYHTKFKNVDKPLLYVKMKEFADQKITGEEFNTFIQNFKFDK